MSSFSTWADIKAKVQKDLDLESETFVTADELLGYANEAIKKIEREIHTIYEDYFLTRSSITLVPAQEEYDLPSDIFANKIRAVVYRTGSTVNKVSRVMDWNKFYDYECDKASGVSTQVYSYFILNQTAGSPKIVLTPTPSEAGNFVKIWYLRCANQLTTDSSICDLPECYSWLIQDIKVRCYEKEVHPNLGKAIADLESEKQATIAALTCAVPDGENEIEPDFRLYREMT